MEEARLFRGGRDARLGIVGGDLPFRSGHKAARAAGIVAPAVRVRVFFAAVIQACDLVFEAGAVALANDGGCDENQQVALDPELSLSWKA